VSLRQQFVLVFVAFSVVMSALGGGLAYQTASRALERELDAKLVGVATAAAEVGLDAGRILGLRPGEEGLLEFRSIRSRIQRLQSFVDEAYILRSDLTALVTTLPADSIPIGATLWELAPFSEEIREAVLLGQSVSPLFYVETEGRHFKYGFVRLEQSDAVLAVLMPADFMAPLYAFRRTMIGGSILAAVVAALIAWILATTVTRSLNRLGRVALRIQRGRMDEPVGQERGGELGRLSRAMERMREGILQRDEHLRLMLAQVAHEIRNPLGGLELFASAAADTEDADERGHFIRKVRSEVAALNRIIDDFLAFAKPLRPEVLLHDVREPVREAVELVEMETRGAGREFAVELPPESLMAKADPEHVKRVVLNLVRNAAQAGNRVRVHCEAHRGEAVIIVKDNGPGVPREMEDRIFEPFVTDKAQGAGLGLAIVKRVVEANQGRVEANSGDGSIGDGAEFRVYFRGGEDLAPEESGN
jgi:two-component system, OmpR family, sensor kinase